MKICSKCGKKKIILEFYKNDRYKNGYNSRCKKCIKECNNLWMEKNIEHRIWIDLKNRCINKNSTSYKNYGSRGIRVCDRWLNSFENFLADMGPKPSPELSIDRINNDEDYCPENCRWATRKEQNINQRVAKNLRWFIAINKKLGIEHRSYNQSTFAREWNLYNTNISSCLNKKYNCKSVKGWTFQWLKELL